MTARSKTAAKKRAPAKRTAAKRPARPRTPKPAWTKYARGSEVDHFAAFCREHLVQSIDAWDGLPLELEPFQRRIFGEALAYDDNGWPVWQSVVIVMPRKNGKTMSLAAYAVYRLLTSDGSPEILLAAASDKQAGRLFNAAATFVRRSPVLSELCRVRDYVGEIVREDGQGSILRMASDPGKLHGYNPSDVVCDELAQWTTPNLKRAYAALTSGGGARSAPRVFTITVAGEAATRNDSILGRILDNAEEAEDAEREPGLTIARLTDSQMLVVNHSAPTTDPNDVDAMKLANPASWITKDYLARQAANPELTDGEVLQLHGCVWAAGSDAWVSPEAWAACARRGAHARAVPEGTRITLGFDGSYNQDSTALVGCTIEEIPHVFTIAVWERPPSVREWIVPRDAVEMAVHQAFERYDVVEFAADPPGWQREIEEWAERYGSPPVVEYQHNQPKVMAPACEKFYSAVVNGRLTHDGNPDLARHIGHARTKETPDGAYIRKESRSSPRKIDLAVCAVAAFDRVESHESVGVVY